MTRKPTPEYARAVGDVTRLARCASPKGGFAAAIVQDKSWSDGASFNPDRFSGQDQVYPRSKEGPLKMLVAESAFASLLDFEWKMAPKQNLHFGRWISSGWIGRTWIQTPPASNLNCWTRLGTKEDWTYLRQAEAATYKNSLELKSADPFIDFYTNITIQSMWMRFSTWKVPEADTCLVIPTEQQPLQPRTTMFQTNITVPTTDEDWPMDDPAQTAKFVAFSKAAPMVDNFNMTWQPGQDTQQYVMEKLGKMWPRTLGHWNDRYSDRALELIAFNGVGQHMLEKVPTPESDGSYYGIFLNFMDGLEVRPGFAKYGADAFFNKDGKVVKIVRQGVTYGPDHDQWEYAKMSFRGSLIVKVTAVDHLQGIHDTLINSMAIASREELAPNHPLRRLLKPWTFRIAVLNTQAAASLYQPKGLLQRGTALTLNGMKTTWDYCQQALKLETFPEMIKRQNIDTVTLPFHEDGLDYYNIVHKFVSDYVDLYYKSDSDLDAGVHSFWKSWSDNLPGHLRPLNLDGLKDVVAQTIVIASGHHNQVGTLGEYITDPTFAPFSWVEGELSATPFNALMMPLVYIGANLDQPRIMEDFSHVMLDDKAKAVCHAFTADLQKFVDTVEGRNTKRVRPYSCFNPKYVEMAASI